MAKIRKSRSFSRFSLRAVLITITLVAVGLAIDRRYRLQQEVVWMLPKGTTAEYHPASIPGASGWFGGYYRDVDAVDFSNSMVTDDALLLLQRLPRLERLYVPNSRITDAQLALIARLPRLRRLALWSNDITDDGVSALTQLTRLEALDVHNTKLMDHAAPELAKLTRLRLLDIRQTAMTDKSLEQISQIPGLRELRVSFSLSDRGVKCLCRMPHVSLGSVTCADITDQGLRELGSLERSISEIYGIENSQITDDGLIELMRTRRRAVGERFFLKHCPVSDRVLPHLPWTPLSKYFFQETNITFRGVGEQWGGSAEVLRMWPERIEIGCDDCEEIGAARLRPVANLYRDCCNRWVVMEQRAENLGDEDLLQLPNLSWAGFRTDDRIDRYLECLQHHKRLTGLAVLRRTCDPGLVEKISELSQLRRLTLYFHKSEQGLDIAPLAKLTQLRELYCRGYPIAADGLTTIGQLSKLESLELDGSLIQVRGFEELGSLKNLTYLLILGEGNWDCHVDQLARLTTLEYLRIEHVTLGPENVRRLQTMPNMEQFEYLPP